MAPFLYYYFTVRIERKFVIILSLKIPPHLKCVATLPCEMSSALNATIENKTTSVATHFKKLTTGNSVFTVTVRLTDGYRNIVSHGKKIMAVMQNSAPNEILNLSACK